MFHELGPEQVLDAVEAAGLALTGRCNVLRCLENRVYDVELEDGSHVVAKFYRPGRWSREGIAEEHRFLLDLAEAEVPVCAPLPFSSDGDTLRMIEGIHYAIWPRTGGREPDELGGEEIAILGRLLARIHAVGAMRGAPHRPLLDADGAFSDPLDLLLDGGFVPRVYAGRYEDAAEALADVYHERSAAVPFQRIHGDCHRGNLLRGDRGWFFLDFDDMWTGPAVHDLWVLVPERDAEGARRRAALLDAYRQFRDFDEAWLSLVEPLRAHRFLRVSSWIASRWDEPAFRSTFPHFGTDTYWEAETRDLEEQLARVAGEPGGPY